jgi:protein arginine N-methyltransferase 3
MAAASEAALDLGFWSNVEGFSFRPVCDMLREEALSEAFVAPVHPDHLLSEAQPVRALDLATMRPNDVEFSTSFALEASPSVCHPS